MVSSCVPERGTRSIRKLLIFWRPRRDSNPCYRRERANWPHLTWSAMLCWIVLSLAISAC
jgi:hypothetical protein